MEVLTVAAYERVESISRAAHLSASLSGPQTRPCIDCCWKYAALGYECVLITSARDVPLLQRIHFDYKDISVGTGNLPVLERAVDELAKRYSMEWQVC